MAVWGGIDSRAHGGSLVVAGTHYTKKEVKGHLKVAGLGFKVHGVQLVLALFGIADRFGYLLGAYTVGRLTLRGRLLDHNPLTASE